MTCERLSLILLAGCFNPLSPHDALKHHFASKGGLNFPFLNKKNHGIFKIIATYFVQLPHDSSHLHPLQVENCDSNSRLVVGEDDNGEFRPERVKT